MSLNEVKSILNIGNTNNFKYKHLRNKVVNSKYADLLSIKLWQMNYDRRFDPDDPLRNFLIYKDDWIVESKITGHKYAFGSTIHQRVFRLFKLSDIKTQPHSWRKHNIRSSEAVSVEQFLEMDSVPSDIKKLILFNVSEFKSLA